MKVLLKLFLAGILAVSLVQVGFAAEKSKKSSRGGGGYFDASKGSMTYVGNSVKCEKPSSSSQKKSKKRKLPVSNKK